jgi:hypothetical protein
MFHLLVSAFLAVETPVQQSSTAEPAMADTLAAAPATEWRTLGRGTLATDSVFVRALWTSLDQGSGESSFLSYRIENSRGRVVFADSLSKGDEDWCETLKAAVTPWRSGIRITVAQVSYPCYWNCGMSRFVLVAPDTVAVSDWLASSWFDGQPAGLEPRFVWLDEAGIRWQMPVRVEVSRTRIEFVEQLSQAALNGEPFPVEVREAAFFPRLTSPGEPLPRVTLFPSPTAAYGRQVGVSDDVRRELLIGMARKEKSGEGTPRLLRVQVRIGDVQGWVDCHELGMLGWIEP